MASIWDIVRAFLMLLPPIIFFHELGHFLAARWCGVRVLRFSLGFGPKIFSFQIGPTEYQLAWIPLGGFVRMAGESPESDDSTGASDEFLTQVWWKKAIIAFAGPFMNLVLAYALLVVMWHMGARLPDFGTRIGRITSGSFAANVGFQRGDELVSLDGQPVSRWSDLDQRLRESGPTQRHVQLRRAGQTVELSLADADRDKLRETLIPQYPPVLGSVLPGQPAYQAGLRDGDRILQAGGQPIDEWLDLQEVIFKSAEQKLRLRVQRGDRTLELTVVPQRQEKGARGGRIGVTPKAEKWYVMKGQGWLEASKTAWVSVWIQVRETYVGFGKLVSQPQHIADQVGGPLMISQLAGFEVRQGVSDFLWFSSFISIAIMAFNLLPIPILDGGHILFSLIEAVRRRPLSMAQLEFAQKVGMVILGSIMVFVLLNDSVRSIQRYRNASAGDHHPARPGEGRP